MQKKITITVQLKQTTQTENCAAAKQKVRAANQHRERPQPSVGQQEPDVPL